MNVYEPLPGKISSRLVRDLPPHVVQRLRYLWKAAHEALTTTLESVSLSHQLSREFMKLSLEHGVYLPEQISNMICKSCCVLLVPSITCRSRLRCRSSASRCNTSAANRNLLQQQQQQQKQESDNNRGNSLSYKIKNQVVRSCLVCSHITNPSVGCPTSKRVTATGPSSSLKSPLVAQGSSSSSKTGTSLQSSSKATTSSSRLKPADTLKRFSFHDSLQRRQSDPIKPSSSSGLNSDFISLSSALSGKRSFNLIEQERLNKKHHR